MKWDKERNEDHIIEDRQCTYNVNNEARSCNYICRGRSSITYSKYVFLAVAYREGLGVQPPSPKFRSFDKAEPNSQFRGKYIRKCLVFLFHHPN
jgi:hypothetical protein